MIVTVHFVGFHPRLILQGFEQVRLRYPVKRIYLLFDRKQDRYGSVSRYNVRRLSQELAFFGPVTIPLNPLSFREVFSKVYGIVEAETGAGHTVLIDLTDMPPMMASAVTLVSTMVKGVYLYGVQPDARGEFIPDPDSVEFEEWVMRKDDKDLSDIIVVHLPEERLRLLGGAARTGRMRRILEVLYNKGGSVRSIKRLIELCGEDGRDEKTKVYYSRYVAELKDKGLVSMEHSGKERTVRITEFGRAYVEAWRRVDELKARIREREGRIKMPRLPAPVESGRF